jgi:hypothetical protein
LFTLFILKTIFSDEEFSIFSLGATSIVYKKEVLWFMALIIL